MSNKTRIKLFNSAKSKQIDEKSDELFSNKEGILEPEVGFEELLYAYDNSSIIAGIIKKISSKVDSGFELTENEQLDTILKNLDMEIIAQNRLNGKKWVAEKFKFSHIREIKLV